MIYRCIPQFVKPSSPDVIYAGQLIALSIEWIHLREYGWISDLYYIYIALNSGLTHKHFFSGCTLLYFLLSLQFSLIDKDVYINIFLLVYNSAFNWLIKVF